MTNNKKAGPGRAVWDFLASVKLAVVLLIILAIASILGALPQGYLPQGQAPQVYQQLYGSAGAKFILAVGLDNVYTSPWYLTLLFGLALNLIVCSIERLPKAWKAAFNRPDPNKLRLPKLKTRREIILSSAPDRALDMARTTAKALGGMLEDSPGENKTVVFAQSGGWSRMGAYIIHLSILILFAGGMLTGLVGFKGFVNILEGDSADHIVLKRGQTRELGYTVTLDKFTYEQYPNGTPKIFRSDLTFTRDGKVFKKAAVEVNDPTTVDGITYYMSSYGEDLGQWLDLGLTRAGGVQSVVRLPVDKVVDIKDVGRLSLVNFRSNIRGVGPGAMLKLEKPGAAKPEVFWVITRPPFQMRKNAAEVFSLKDFDTRWYAGLQANYDPGVAFVWIGSILMTLGLIVAFFWSHRRLYIEVCPHSEGARVTLAASANRNKPGLDRYFETVCSQFEELSPKKGKGSKQ